MIRDCHVRGPGAGIALALACLLVAPALQAAPTVIYRCTGADGAVTFQNDTPCAAGQQQQRRVIDIAAPIPAFTPPPVVPEAAPGVPLISELPAPAETALESPEDASRPPPPTLFTCRMYDNRSYWRDDGTPPLRCRPLPTVGIGGLPGMGAGQACEMHADVCTEVPETERCLAWDNRVREAEFRWRFGEPGERESARLDYERLFTLLQTSHCAVPAG